MTDTCIDMSQRKVAIAAGIGFFIMTFAAIFAIYFVFENLKVPGDANTTAINIMSNELLFRLGIFSLIIVLICDVLVAWALYFFLKPVNKSLALLAAWLRLAYAAFIGIALLNLVFVLLLLSNADYLNVIETNELYAQVLLSFNAFDDIWKIGIIIFSAHLIVLGYLVFKSTYVPKIFGILIIIASFGYLTDSLVHLLSPDYENYKAIIGIVFIVPQLAGELGLAFWLLFRGGKIPKLNSLDETKTS